MAGHPVDFHSDGNWPIKDNVTLTYDNNAGKWGGSYKIPWDFKSGSYASGVYPVYAQDDYIVPNTGQGSLPSLTINIATLTVTADAHTSAVNRTLSMTITSAVTYPDGTVMDSTRLGYVRATLTFSDLSTYGPVDMTWSNNFWNVTIRIPYDEVLGSTTVTVAAYDKATAANTGSKTDTFTINPATLTVDVSTNTMSYQRTEIVTVDAYINYPDGTEMTDPDAEVVVTITEMMSGTVVVSPTAMDYDSGNHWYKSYHTGWNNPLGTYHVEVTASDSATNTGSGESFFDVFVAILDVTVDTYSSDYTTVIHAFNRPDTIYIKAVVTYPDNTAMSNANGGQVIAHLYHVGETGEVGSAILAWDVAKNGWTGTIIVSPSAKLGWYFLTVEAADSATDGQTPSNPKHNYGSGKLEGLLVGVPGGLAQTDAKILNGDPEHIWFIYSTNTYAPQGYRADMDSTSLDAIYGKSGGGIIIDDTNPAILYTNPPWGKPDPSAIPGGDDAIVTWGGPGAHVVNYYFEQNDMFAPASGNPGIDSPVRMMWDSSYYWFETSGGTQVTGTKVLKTSVTQTHTYFVLMVYVDADGRFVFTGYGYNRQGTRAAALWYIQIVNDGDLSTYTNAWYIFEATTTPEGLLVGTPTLVATGN